ncbi:hypothetical protein OFB80_28370, partial [Escherichia coli]|nr:hypothetical protein [Escherichia coli]
AWSLPLGGPKGKSTRSVRDTTNPGDKAHLLILVALKKRKRKGEKKRKTANLENFLEKPI